MADETKRKITYRTWQDGDAKGIRRCIRSFYKDGYPYKKYLDGRTLSSLFRAKKMLITVGVDENNIIRSTVSALFEGNFTDSCLLMLRVVDPLFRGVGIGDENLEYLLKKAWGRESLMSLYADVMTHDCVSQKSLIRNNYYVTGVRLCLYFSDILVPDMFGDKRFKMSQLVMMAPTVKVDELTLYVCESQRKIVEHIYALMGIKVKFGSEISGCDGEERVFVHKNETHMSLEAIIESPIETTRVMVPDGYTAVAYLNMADPRSPKAYGNLYEDGFRFTGVKPLNGNGEFMILSCIRNTELNFEDIKIVDEGKYLFTYVKKELEI